MPAEQLEPWVAEVLAAFDLSDTQVNIDKVLSLAGVVAHGVLRPAAPLTTFISGYAAGLAVGRGEATEQNAMESADSLVREVLKKYLAAEVTEA